MLFLFEVDFNINSLDIDWYKTFSFFFSFLDRIIIRHFMHFHERVKMSKKYKNISKFKYKYHDY